MASAHDKYAKDYDNQLDEYDCRIADVLFGMSYEYIYKGENLLDIGIGTGVSSCLFHKAGLSISGIDGSREMLKICKMKGIAYELYEHDLFILPWPIQKKQFKHVICCGVFHFMAYLDMIFHEISQLHNEGGIFSFTIMNDNFAKDQQEKYKSHLEGEFVIYTHNMSYINQLLNLNHYKIEKEIVVLVGETQFRTIVALKNKS